MYVFIPFIFFSQFEYWNGKLYFIFNKSHTSRVVVMTDTNFPAIVEDSDDSRQNSAKKESEENGGNISYAKALEELKKELEGIEDRYSDSDDDKSSTERMVEEGIGKKANNFELKKAELTGKGQTRAKDDDTDN